MWIGKPGGRSQRLCAVYWTLKPNAARRCNTMLKLHSRSSDSDHFAWIEFTLCQLFESPQESYTTFQLIYERPLRLTRKR
jgi:hypothetical protein